MTYGLTAKYSGKARRKGGRGEEVFSSRVKERILSAAGYRSGFGPRETEEGRGRLLTMTIVRPTQRSWMGARWIGRGELLDGIAIVQS